MLTVKDIQERVIDINKWKSDDEKAHGMEDSLWKEVLEAISKGDCDDATLCAAEALKTRELDFQRWCG
jgi:hypothetical protein